MLHIIEGIVAMVVIAVLVHLLLWLVSHKKDYHAGYESGLNIGKMNARLDILERLVKVLERLNINERATIMKELCNEIYESNKNEKQ